MLVMAAISITVWSCHKNDSDTDETQIDNTETLSSIELVTAVDGVDGVLDETLYYGNDFIDFNALSDKGGRGQRHHDRSGYFPDCALIVKDTIDDTITTTISFEDGCTDNDGNVLSGTATLVKTTSTDSRSRSATFTDFTVNGYVVNGNRTFEYISANADGNPQTTSNFDITVETEAGTITKIGNKLSVITAGGDTDTHQDDERTTTGSSTYTDADGVVTSTEITSALVRPAGCRYVAQGVKQYTTDGVVSTVDYGDGTCDNLATQTEADGTVTEITLRCGGKGKNGRN